MHDPGSVNLCIHFLFPEKGLNHLIPAMPGKEGKMEKVDEVRFSREARNFLKKADPKLRNQIKEGIEGIKIIPSKGDIKPMRGYDDGRMRLRIGKYRVIYRYERNILLVLFIIDIGSRGDIYK